MAHSLFQSIIWTNACWFIVNWTTRNKNQRSLNENATIFIEDNVFENIVCNIVAILYRPECVDYDLFIQT